MLFGLKSIISSIFSGILAEIIEIVAMAFFLKATNYSLNILIIIWTQLCKREK